MAKEWYNTFIKMGKENDFSVDIKEFQATTLTLHNQDGSKTDIIHNAKLRYDLLK